MQCSGGLSARSENRTSVRAVKQKWQIKYVFEEFVLYTIHEKFYGN